MLKEFLPKQLFELISREDIKNIYEIRLRVGSNILVNYLNELKFVSVNGLKDDEKRCNPMHKRDDRYNYF